MNVTAVGALPVGALLWQRNGNWIQTVICKATFDLLPGEAQLAGEQESLNVDDAHLEDDPGRSMQAPSDLVPFKARAEVLLVGYAFAPRGDPLRHLVVRMIVGEIDKSFEVVGDRAFGQDGALREGPRFTRMPLRYERAGGGPETANPIGVSPDAPPDPYGMIPIPNLQPLGFTPSRPREVILPVGFGPLSGSWPSRREKLGRLTSLPESWDGATLPADLEPAYFNYAPRDQQVDRLRDNERLVLENLHLQHPRLVTNLPGVRPRAFADRGEGLQEIAMVCDTLCIDTGRGTCTLTWRGYVESPPARGTVVVALEGPDRPLPWAEVQIAARRASTPKPPLTPAAAAALAGPAADAPPSTRTMPFVSRRTTTASDSGLPFGSPGNPAPGSGTSTVTPAPTWGRPSSSTSTFVRDAATGALRAESAQPAPEGRQGAYALPFAQPGRAEQPGPYGSEVSAPGDASPAWLQGRAGSPSGPPPSSPSGVAPPGMSFSALLTPPAAVPAPPAPVVAPLISSQGPAATGPSSPWAAGVPSSAIPLATVAPVIVAAPARSSSSLAGSAAAASDAAAEANARPLSTPVAAPAPRAPAPAPSAEKAARAAPSEVLELIWYDEPHVARIRAWWEELVTELDFEPSDPRRDLGAEDPDKARSRHNVFGIMTDGEVVDTSGVARVIAGAVNARGRFTPPLALVGGELRFPFDEVETLKATIVAITPLVGNDKRLKESLDSMNELVKTPYLQGSTGVGERLTRELRDQFREASRSLPAGFLDGHVERLLLEQRRYCTRKVFGGEFIRALLVSPGASSSSGGSGTGSSASSGEAPIPVYLPKHLDQTLPMLVVMKARLIVEAHLQQDPYDASPYALRAAALGRSFQLDGWRAGGASASSGGGASPFSGGKSAGDGERA